VKITALYNHKLGILNNYIRIDNIKIVILHCFFQPDSSVIPFFDSLVTSSGLDNMFSIQLCGLVYKINNMSDIEMGGTLVCILYM